VLQPADPEEQLEEDLILRVGVEEGSVQCAISDFPNLGYEDGQVGEQSVDWVDETSVGDSLPTAGAVAVKMGVGDMAAVG